MLPYNDCTSWALCHSFPPSDQVLGFDNNNKGYSLDHYLKHSLQNLQSQPPSPSNIMKAFCWYISRSIVVETEAAHKTLFLLAINDTASMIRRKTTCSKQAMESLVLCHELNATKQAQITLCGVQLSCANSQFMRVNSCMLTVILISS